VAVLFIYTLSILTGVLNLPTGAEAAWNNNKTWTTKGDFESSTTLANVLTSGDNDASDSNNNDSFSTQSESGFSNTISAGNGFALAVKTDGTLWSSGYNGDGALGVGNLLPQQGWRDTGITNVKEVSAYFHSLILKNDGTVWGAGNNDYGKIGDGTTSYRSTFVQGKLNSTTPLTNIKKIIATDYNSYALSFDNKLYSVGYNTNYQLGTGLNTPSQVTYWQEVVSAGSVLDFAASSRSVLIVRAESGTGKKEVLGLGLNIYGELSLGHTNQVAIWTKSVAFDDILSVSMGQFHSTILVNDGSERGVVYSVGYAADYRLGLGDSVNRSTWSMTSMSGVKRLLAGFNSTHVIKSDGTAWGVGFNSWGNLGVGDRLSKAVWTQIPVENIQNISGGPYSTTLFLKNSGNLYGAGFSAQDVFSTNKPSATNSFAVSQVDTGISAIDTSYSGSSYVKNGFGYVAGLNWDYRLGFSDAWHKETFTQLSTNNISKIENAESNTYIIKKDKTLWGMGVNSTGQLSVGNTTYSFNTFQQAKLDATTYLLNVEQVSAGANHAIAMTTNGDVYTVGYNNNGQIGDGTTVNSLYWKLVSTGAAKVYAGRYYSAVLKTDGTLSMVGNNAYGQYGLGTTTSIVTNWTTAATGVLDYYVGPYHNHIKKTDGIYAAGYNQFGALGDGSTTHKYTWTKLTSINGGNVATITSGYYNSGILYNDGTYFVTGHNYYGQLGLGDFLNRTSFTQVPVSGIVKASFGQFHAMLLKNDGSLLVTGNDFYGQLGLGRQFFSTTLVQTNSSVRQPSPFLTTGSVSGLKIDGGAVSKWVNVIWDATVPTGTTLKIRARGAATDAGLASAVWGDWKTASGDNPGVPNSQWLELEAVLESSDGAFSPVVNSLTVIYYTDVDAPTNPTTFSAWNSPAKSVSLADTVWQKSSDVYLEWSGDADVGESGVKGYWVYFGTDPTADPRTAGAFQTTPSITKNIPDIDSGKTYYLCISTEDFAQNRYLNESGLYYKTFTYRFDKTSPDAPSHVSVTPAGWTTQNNFSFTWPAATDVVVNSGSSEVAGYQYKREGGGDTWSSIITDLSVANIASYQSGQNIFSIRTVDQAGNVSPSTQVNYYYNADAPTKPTNLRVAPQSSDKNAFTFDWDAPSFANGGVKGYYYSINATPNSHNTVFTTSTTTGEIAAATQQSFNTFYVVATDITDNINWGSYESIQFECNTSAPGIPLKPEVFDTSNRDIPKYSVAVNWAEPTYKGVGFKEYVVERSLDNANFTVVGTSSGTSYVDTGLESRTYAYRIMARDNSGNTSAPSEIVSVLPTGRYTSAPVITVQPEATVKVSTASIRWVTDRGASSFVEIGEDVKYGLTQGQFDFVTDHKVSLGGLKPGTIYHYRVKFVDEDGNIGYSVDKTLQTEPAPRVERVSINDVRLYTAVLTWYTSEPAESNLHYGRGTGYGSEIKNVSGGATTVHSVRLEGLEHSSTYHFAVRIKDIDGNEILSDDYSFETQKFPVISLVRMESVKDSASATTRVTWQTNVPTNSVVEYTPIGGNTQEVVKTKLAMSHDVTVTGLIDNTYYRLVAKSTDQYGNTAISDPQNYRTDFDTRSPVLSNLSYEISSSGYGVDAKTQIVIYWESDEPGTSQIEYGIGISGDYTSKSMEDASLGTSHVVVVSDLKPSTSYHFRAVSRDGSRNEGFTDDTAILTEQSRSSIIDVVFQTLQNALGWMFGV